MSKNEPLPINTAEDSTLSTAVAAIVEMTNVWATGAIEFEADQTNLIHYYGLKIKGAIDGIFGKPVNPQELSQLRTSIQKLRDQKAANDAQADIAA